MAVGDDATEAGFPLVPSTGGELARVRYGAREINRTRDFVGQVKSIIPVGEAAYQEAAGIFAGVDDPLDAEGEDGQIYLKVLP